MESQTLEGASLAKTPRPEPPALVERWKLDTIIFLAVDAGLFGFATWALAFGAVEFAKGGDPSLLGARLFMGCIMLFLAFYAFPLTWRVAVLPDGFRPDQMDMFRWMRGGLRRKIEWKDIRSVDVLRTAGVDRLLVISMFDGGTFRFVAADGVTVEAPVMSSALLSRAAANGVSINGIEETTSRSTNESIQFAAKGDAFFIGILIAILAIGCVLVAVAVFFLVSVGIRGPADALAAGVPLAIGSSLVALMAWLWGQRRVGGAVEFSDRGVYVPFHHWWDPAKCWVPITDVVATRWGPMTMNKAEVGSLQASVPFQLRRKHIRWLMTPQPTEVVFVTKLNVCRVSRIYFRDLEAQLQALQPKAQWPRT